MAVFDSESGRQAGLKSGEARRAKFNFRKSLETLASMPLKKGKAKSLDGIKSAEDIEGQNITVGEFALYQMMVGITSGDPKFLDMWNKMMGAYTIPPSQEEAPPIIDALADFRSALEESKAKKPKKAKKKVADDED